METQTKLPPDRCPCCGGPVSKARFLVDVEACVIVFDGKIKKFPARIIEILSVLQDAWPRGVDVPTLARKVFGGLSDVNDNTLSVLISQHRNPLRQLGIEIMSCQVEDHRGKRLQFAKSDIVVPKPFAWIDRKNQAPAPPPDNPRLPDIKRHGIYAYRTKGCRCRECVTAFRTYNRVYQRRYYHSKVKRQRVEIKPAI